MKKRRIGKTALDVTEYSFGGASLGNLYAAVSRDDAMAFLAKLEQDTAAPAPARPRSPA